MRGKKDFAYSYENYKVQKIDAMKNCNSLTSLNKIWINIIFFYINTLPYNARQL